MLIYKCRCSNCLAPSSGDTVQRHLVGPGMFAEFSSRCLHWRLESDLSIEEKAEQIAGSIMPDSETELSALRSILGQLLLVHHEWHQPTEFTKLAHKVATKKVTAYLALSEMDKRGMLR